MFNLKFWLNLATNSQEYIWIEAILIKETPKAILINFDGQNIWLSKAWILRIKRTLQKNVVAQFIGQKTPSLPDAKHPEAISIKISQYHWTKKF